LETFVDDDPEFLNHITGFSGTSAGAILASLLACGMSLSDLKTLVEVVDFSTFLDESLSSSFPDCIKDLYLVEQYDGLCSGSAFYDFMGVHISSLTGSKDTTFQELWDAKGIRLILTVTDLRGRKSVHLDHVNHPDMPIRLAVRMSMSIPFVFRPVVYRGMVCVDGGLLDNMPLHVFDEWYAHHETLGLMLETPDEWYVDQGLPVPCVLENPVGSLASFGSSLIDTVQAAMRHNNFSLQDQARLVVIPVPDIPVTTFALSGAQKATLLGAYGKSIE
jgi:predicted acylesterase/phospholipase RssA